MTLGTIMALIKSLGGSSGGGGSGGGGVLAVGATTSETTATLDKTWQEIADAPCAVLILEDGESGIVTRLPLLRTWQAENVYTARFVMFAEAAGIELSVAYWEFATDSADGYPSASLD